MKKALFAAVAVALTASACAQMPLPLADQSAPAQAQAQTPQLPASVERLTLIPFLGDLIAVMPRKASDNCPAIARFRLLTVDSGVQQRGHLRKRKIKHAKQATSVVGISRNPRNFCAASPYTRNCVMGTER